MTPALLATLMLSPTTPAEPTLPVAAETDPLSPGQRRRVWLGAATLTSALTAGGLAIVSGYEHERYLDDDTPYEDLEAIERRTNLTSGLAIASGVASVGFGTALVLTW